MAQQRAHRQRQEDPAGGDRRPGDLGEHRCRGAFDDHPGQLAQGRDRRRVLQRGQTLARAQRVARGDRYQPDARHRATIDGPRHSEPYGAEPGDAYSQVLVRGCHLVLLLATRLS